MHKHQKQNFVNNQVTNVLNILDIEHIITKNETKANYAERVIRTIKDKLGKYMEEKQTYEWVDVLPQITRSYNHTPHRSIGMRPINVSTSNQVNLWNRLFASVESTTSIKSRPPKTRAIRFKFKIGDHVRISTFKGSFEKTSFSHRWTSEIFIIRKRYIRQGRPIYELDDYMSEKVEGRFYEQELQAVRINKNKEYKIEKIIKKRKVAGNNIEYLVKFKGWPKKYNSWVKDITKIKK